MEQRGWIASKWGLSDNNRKAKFYSLTRKGCAQLQDETSEWNQMAAVINRILKANA
jgi:DNA-binding PadR family transcriptional regulator